MDKPHACVSRIGKINFDYADFKEALDKIPKGIPNVLLAKHSYVEGGGGEGKIWESIVYCETPS